MKVCPFCKEEIRDDAIKCRYCHSSLLPPQAAPDGDNAPRDANAGRTVYVLDNGLIAFAKFVAGALAIFVTVGIFLYGIDIKESLKQMDESNKTAASAALSVQQTELAVKQAQDQVTSVQGQASTALAQTQASLASLQQQLKDVQDKQLQTNSAASAALAAQAKVQAAQGQIAQLEQSAKTQVANAQSLVSQIESEKQQADVAAAHIVALDPNHAANQNAENPVIGSTPANSPAFHPSPLSPAGLRALYNFPTQLTGNGQVIGLIELGGAYRDEDLKTYFTKMGMAVPQVVAVSIDGAGNASSGTGSQFGSDAEVEGDIEVAGAVAPGAKIVVYFAPSTSAGYLHAFSTAIHDQVNRPTVISDSWGSAEGAWAPGALSALNKILAEAEPAGITIVAAAGDNGPKDGTNKPAVDFPGSSPWVTAVGGSEIVLQDGKIQAELLWDDLESGQGGSGYGTSVPFSVPSWQSGLAATSTGGSPAGRSVPDVVAQASLKAGGYNLYVDGKWSDLGGTGMTTPLWAGFIALLNQGLGHNIGFFNPVLYQKLGPTGALRQISLSLPAGHVSSESAPKPGTWQPQTGWGAPDGQKMLAALRSP